MWRFKYLLIVFYFTFLHFLFNLFFLFSETPIMHMLALFSVFYIFHHYKSCILFICIFVSFFIVSIPLTLFTVIYSICIFYLLFIFIFIFSLNSDSSIFIFFSLNSFLWNISLVIYSFHSYFSCYPLLTLKRKWQLLCRDLSICPFLITTHLWMRLDNGKGNEMAGK